MHVSVLKVKLTRPFDRAIVAAALEAAGCELVEVQHTQTSGPLPNLPLEAKEIARVAGVWLQSSNGAA